ncbi:MAG TPA: hypothetical protein VE028_01320 [Nitratidesulfovibrio sp.]|nr:hypothetical protein [Nitratidesulfovibrio sp.]
MVKDEKCYMCEKDATSREHVPPKCLFPESSEFHDNDYRKNIITVPSCDEHNSKKSKDDEFLLLNIPRISGNNTVGFIIGSTKVSRAFDRSPHLEDAVFKNKKTIEIPVKSESIKITYGNPDHLRLIKCFERIFFGLYRHHYGENFSGQIKVFFDCFVYEDTSLQNYKKLIRVKIAEDLEGKEVFGENPDVFTYQFTDPDVYGIIACKATFYQNTVIYGAYRKEEQNDLLSILIRDKVCDVYVKNGDTDILISKAKGK